MSLLNNFAMPKKLIIANWKMLPETLGEAQGILEAVDEHLRILPSNISLVVCPPFVFIEEVSKMLQTTELGQRAVLGAQDIALADGAALTGEVSGAQLEKLGVRYVIIGHSERRWKLGESDAVVNEKLVRALADGLTPIVCIGERERDDQFKDTLRNQLEATFANISELDRQRCIIAYEPVWAISTNPGARPDTPENALESIAIIRAFIPDAPVLYGGSVNLDNAQSFLSTNGIDGVLVGGASVRTQEFLKILTIASAL